MRFAVAKTANFALKVPKNNIRFFISLRRKQSVAFSMRASARDVNVEYHGPCVQEPEQGTSTSRSLVDFWALGTFPIVLTAKEKIVWQEVKTRSFGLCRG